MILILLEPLRPSTHFFFLEAAWSSFWYWAIVVISVVPLEALPEGVLRATFLPTDFLALLPGVNLAMALALPADFLAEPFPEALALPLAPVH